MSGAGIYIKTPSGLVAAATVPGVQGSQGPQSSLTAGPVTTGAAGTNAAATITGAGPVQTLNLTIPKGDPGGWVNAALLAAPDLNTVLTPGLYFLTGAHTNSPVAGEGHLEVMAYATANVLQRYTRSQLGDIWERRRWGSNWYPWIQTVQPGRVGSGDLTGTGSPEGVVTAQVGTYYTDTALTNGITRWEKRTGAGNTGWVPSSRIEGTTPTTLTGVLAGNGSVVAATPSIPVLRNLLPNSSFAGGTTAWWTGNQATLAVSGGILTATAVGAASGTTTAVSGGLVQGRIYYVSARARVQSACQYISTYDGVALVTMQGSPAADAWLDVSAQFVARGNYTSVNFYQGFVDAPTAAGKTLDIDYAVAIDLTTCFGAGKEPSKAEMDAIMADLGNWFADTDPKVVPTYSKRFRESAVANLVRNTYFHTGTAGWIATGATLATSASLATFTGTGSVYFPFAAYDTSELRLGQKGYIRAQVRAASGTAPTNLQLQYGGMPVTLASPVVGTWYTLSGVVTAPNSGAVSSMVVLAQYADAAAANGAVVEFRHPLAINLTATFGAGNEPTASEMDALLSKYPNSNFQGTVNDLFAPVKEYQWRRRGTGSPEGVVTANPGTEWTDTAGTNGAWKWAKKTGTGNTGWKVIEGDTGLRYVSSLLLNGWAGSAYLRRVGSAVELRFDSLSAAAATAGTAMTLPSGFTLMGGVTHRGLLYTNAVTLRRVSTVTDVIIVGYVAGDTLHGTIGIALTSDAWPTTLPGTAA